MYSLLGVAVSAVANARHGHANLLFWESLAGNAQAWLQCSCSVAQAGTKGKRLSFKAGPKGRRGSPGRSLPALLLGRAVPKVTSCTISELAWSPDSQTPWEDGSGLRALALRFVLTEVPCPLH